MIKVRLCKGDPACEREPGPDGFCNRHRPAPRPVKVYLRATGINTFELVEQPEKATADAKEALEVTLKQFKGAALEQAPRKAQQIEPGWIISMEAVKKNQP